MVNFKSITTDQLDWLKELKEVRGKHIAIQCLRQNDKL